MATIRVYSGTVGGAGDGTTWADAYTTLFAALAAEPNGTDYIIHYQHVENYTIGARDWDFSSVLGSFDTCISVDKDNSDAYRRGALIDLNANGFRMGIGGHVMSYGVDWENGNGGSSFATDMHVGDGSADVMTYVDTIFRVHNTSNSGIILFGEPNTKMTLLNVEVKVAGDAFIQLWSPQFRWIDGAFTCENALDLPTAIFQPVVEPTGFCHIEGVDFSSAGDDVAVQQSSSGSVVMLMKRCKFSANWVGDLEETATMESATEVTLENCGGNDVGYTNKHGTPVGIIENQLDLYPAGVVGATYNTNDVPYSLKMSSNADTTIQFRPLYTQWISRYNKATVSTTFTLEFIHNEAAALQDDEVWMMLSYMGNSGNQQSVLKDSCYDDKFGTPNQTATPANIATSTKAWDEGLTARANSTVYAAGDIRKASGSPGLAFIVDSTTGDDTSAASEPAGFTGASDGDVIVDGNVTWHAMRRQKCELTVTPAEQGIAKAQLVVGKDSIEIWASPLLEAA